MTLGLDRIQNIVLSTRIQLDWLKELYARFEKGIHNYSIGFLFRPMDTIKYCLFQIRKFKMGYFNIGFYEHGNSRV